MQEIEIKGLIALDEKKTVCIGNDGSIREIANAKVILSNTLTPQSSNNSVIRIRSGCQQYCATTRKCLLFGYNHSCTKYQLFAISW